MLGKPIYKRRQYLKKTLLIFYQSKEKNMDHIIKDLNNLTEFFLFLSATCFIATHLTKNPGYLLPSYASLMAGMETHIKSLEKKHVL